MNPMNSNTCPVIHIPEAVYRKLGRQIRDDIGGTESYYGEAEYDNGTFYGKLIVNLRCYYEQIIAPDGRWEELDDVVPLWWEFHTFYIDEDEEQPNDFQFGHLKKYLI